jgi:hypothetical protein
VNRYAVIGTLLLFSCFGCGSNNTVTTPTPTPTPIPNVNVNGSWRGTLDQGVFTGTCAATYYQRVLDPIFPFRLDVTTQQATGSAQVAGTASISFVGNTIASAGFVGLSEMNTVTIDASEPILLTALRSGTTMNVTCDNGRVVKLTTGTTRIRGDATSTSWSGTYSETIQVSGGETGVMMLEAHFNLSK